MDLYAGEGEIVGIIGPSGCGKSTLLNILAGFDWGETGLATYLGKPLGEPSPERAMVFQSASLFPWLTVRDNIAYGLKRKKSKHKDIRSLTDQYMKLVGLEDFADFYPDQLSGGMQQRVALTRVLILKPKVLLMDEPFASLDAQSRLVMQQLLLTLWQEFRPTILFVTHDIDEALFLADRIYILSKRPGTVLREMKVPMDRPRSLQQVNASACAQLKNEIMHLLFTGTLLT